MAAVLLLGLAGDLHWDGLGTSPGARLLALQCPLPTDTSGRLRVPHGLLRGMRLWGHTELWQELAQAH
ncbi:hypothetical protein [Streptomyces sp. NPDC051776]|uniref:hypothetical protein n=1 Tax=Streptomyces sp. NPDC051776 TaxID=3155414 RepID=UPI00342DC17C